MELSFGEQRAYFLGLPLGKPLPVLEAVRSHIETPRAAFTKTSRLVAARNSESVAVLCVSASSASLRLCVSASPRRGSCSEEAERKSTHVVRRNRFPAREAAPVEFVGGAQLVGEAEAIQPPFLLGAPSAVPDEFVDVRFGGRVHVHDSDEVRASRPRAEGDVFDGQVGLGREDVREQPANLDARHRTIQPDALQRRRVVRVPLVEAAHDALERLGGFRSG